MHALTSKPINLGLVLFVRGTCQWFFAFSSMLLCFFIFAMFLAKAFHIIYGFLIIQLIHTTNFRLAFSAPSHHSSTLLHTIVHLFIHNRHALVPQSQRPTCHFDSPSLSNLRIRAQKTSWGQRLRSSDQRLAHFSRVVHFYRVCYAV